jgi:hypothetical protein
MAQPITRYRVVLHSKTKGLMDVDLNTAQGEEAAGRRAHVALVATREYGDMEDIHVMSIEKVCWFRTCDAIATQEVAAPDGNGTVPACDGCAGNA